MATESNEQTLPLIGLKSSWGRVRARCWTINRKRSQRIKLTFPDPIS